MLTTHYQCVVFKINFKINPIVVLKIIQGDLKNAECRTTLVDENDQSKGK
jgi:hypothetical protein